MARRLGLPRQRVNYHVRALERDGLVELVAERRRRGCVERVLQASAEAFVVDPRVLAEPSGARGRDRFAAEHLVSAAADLVRDVGRQVAGAHAAGTRLLTFTVETELTFAGAVADALASLAAEHGAGTGARYRVVVGGHPSPTAEGAADEHPA